MSFFPSLSRCSRVGALASFRPRGVMLSMRPPRYLERCPAPSEYQGLRTPIRVLLCSFSSDTVAEGRKKSPLYTRTGDKGTSVLFNGERRPKSDAVFETLGHVDELNAHIGLAREYSKLSNNGLDTKLEKIQSRLLDVGSHVATPRTEDTSANRVARTTFDAANVLDLEGWIDEIDGSTPPLTMFILPSGGLSSSTLHVARTVCRRAERHASTLGSSGDIDPQVLQYLNRLSDFLFASARFAALHDGEPEVAYKKER